MPDLNEDSQDNGNGADDASLTRQERRSNARYNRLLRFWTDIIEKAGFATAIMFGTLWSVHDQMEKPPFPEPTLVAGGTGAFVLSMLVVLALRLCLERDED